MEGYEVVTSDDQTAGRVVAVVGNHLVVERGTLRKHRNVLPVELTEADDSARVVRATISKEMLENAPEVEDAESVDVQAAAVYYGVGDQLDAATAQVEGAEVSVDGYEVVASDDSHIGDAVGVRGQYVIVEHGGLRKHRSALPLAFAVVDDGARKVRVTIAREVLEDGPEIDSDAFDESAVATYYGLSEGFAAPSTEGYGETNPDDPGLSADEDAHRLGIETADQERLRVRQNMRTEGPNPTSQPTGRQIHPDYRSTDSPPREG